MKRRAFHRCAFRASAARADERAGAAEIPLPDGLILVQLALFTLLASSVQGAAGFGFGLIATTGFLWVLASTAAVPLVIVLSLATSSALAIQLRSEVDWRLVRRLLAGAVVGLLPGLTVFRALDATALMIVVSVVVLASVTLLALWGPEQRGTSVPITPRSGTAVLVGVVAGLLAISIGMPGPPVVLYLAVLGAAKDAFRATTLTFFVGAYLAALILHTAVGAVDPFVWTTAVVLLPVALGGAWVGHRVSRRLSEEVFRRAALGLIAIMGVSALASVLLD